MELEVQASVIEYLEPVNGGSLVAVSVMLQQVASFEGMLWQHPNGNELLEMEEGFLTLFGVTETAQLPPLLLEGLLLEIKTILPDKNELFANDGLPQP